MSATLKVPGLLGGRYCLERLLGSGGMGEVYRARDLLHEQFGEPCSEVALKVLNERLAQAPDGPVLLYSEFALARTLRHDHVVRMYAFEVDTASQCAFFTMELMHGLTLEQRLRECSGGMPWVQLQPLALQLLEAVAYIHRQGVLHGDLKPANVMAVAAGLRLFDFGLGHSQAQHAAGLPGLSRSRFNAWTPSYAAPELLNDGVLSSAADLYGAACVLYDLALGKRGEGERSLRPRQWPRYCWPALRAALSADPHRRCITVEELRAVISRRRQCWVGL
ncbi:serine/threonine-protein kinase [Pseudomonas sp. SDO524_S393]